MSRAAFDRLMTETRTLHEVHPAIASFRSLPDGLELIEVEAHMINAAKLFTAKQGLTECRWPKLKDACPAASAHARCCSDLATPPVWSEPLHSEWKGLPA